MLNLGTKSLLALGAATFGASVAYGVATNEGSGTTVLAFVAVGAVSLALVTQAAGIDEADIGAVGEGAAALTPAGARNPLPSVWPLAGAVALALAAVAAATSPVAIIPAVVVGVAVGVGWLFQSWTEHPGYTPRFGARLGERLVAPVATPVAVFALVAVIALSLSRVLLAVPEQASRAIALAVAVVVLAGAFTVSASQRMARTALTLLSVFALVSVVAAGSVGAAYGERHFERKGGVAATPGPGPSAPPVSVSAVDTSGFSNESLSLPATQPVVLLFDNPVTGIPHNIGIYDRQGGKELFRGDIVTGPNTATYHIPPLTAGTLYFQCDVHPNMHGTVTVGAPPAAAPAPSTTAPASTTTTAPGLATT